MQSIQIIYTQVIEKPSRKLILVRGRKATHYFEFCEEVGCDIWGKLLSIKGAIYEPAGMWMPDNLRPSGTSYYTQGVEMPADYDGVVPDGMEVIDLPACHYMVFHSRPYPDEKMNEIIEMTQKAMADFDPTFYGWEWADSDAPRIQLEPVGERGYIESRPVREIL